MNNGSTDFDEDLCKRFGNSKTTIIDNANRDIRNEKHERHVTVVIEGGRRHRDVNKYIDKGPEVMVKQGAWISMLLLVFQMFQMRLILKS